ncbi:hypothetical protein BRADI_4g32820v3 [Brachypodium distachyon]|uniref:Wall-associated receptor kinase galacturonan-binding domain-containing protein n=1 Tax=Brachypodium distachyon TaxID=15368 RepID=I1IQY9_BRADI|nr:hypothetical protein BRADI_4g32820v3 [Brachypodium distachyon]
MKLGCSRLRLCGYFFLCLSAFWMLATVDQPNGQRLGCPTKCGDVDIPFPFGIGEQCALHAGFNLSCPTINSTTKPLAGNIEVTKISVPDGKAWIKTHMSKQCYDPTTRRMNYSDAWLNMRNTPFWLSEVDNI